MGVTPTPPDPPLYRAFTISPSTSASTPKPTWATPTIKESTFPQSSLIAELSSLQERDKSSITDKIARLSGEQRGAVYNVLVDLVAEEGEKYGEGGAGKKGQWSVCEAVRVRDSKRGRTRCVRVFFVRVEVEIEASVVGKEVEKGEVVAKEGKGKGKEKEARSRSRGTEKGVEVSEKEVPAEKSRRKPARERGSSKGKGKEIERVEEKKSRRRSTKSQHRKKESVFDDDDCSCDEHSDTTFSIRSQSMPRPHRRSLSSRFKPRHHETRPTAYGRPEQWEKPVIIPPHFPARGYPPVPPNDYHIRAAYEAGQRDALAERMRNAALERQAMPNGPSHVISFERLRPGFEEWSEGSYSQMGQEAETYVNQRRPPIIQYPRHVIPESSYDTQYGRESYFQDRHDDRRYMGGIQMDSSYDRYGPDTFRQRYAASELRRW